MNKPLQPDMEHRHEKYEKRYHQCAARRDQENSMTESRGAMTAQQFMETEWMVIKPWPASLIVTVADWLIFADDLSAHNTAQLTQELGALKKDCAIAAEADGEVINRQKAELERLRSQGAGQWEAAAREAAKEIKTSPTGHMTCRLSEGHIFDIILKHFAGLASPPEGKP